MFRWVVYKPRGLQNMAENCQKVDQNGHRMILNGKKWFERGPEELEMAFKYYKNDQNWPFQVVNDAEKSQKCQKIASKMAHK